MTDTVTAAQPSMTTKTTLDLHQYTSPANAHDHAGHPIGARIPWIRFSTWVKGRYLYAVAAPISLWAVLAGAAEPPSPALAQYLSQLQCVTGRTVDDIDAGQTVEHAALLAVEICVPQEFVPYLIGLSGHIRPSTRAERVQALIRSVKFRLTLCARQNLSGEACVRMFSASEA